MSDPAIIRRKDALAKGLTHYYTGKPCKRGHVSRRFSGDGRCIECLAVRRADPDYKIAHSAANSRWKDGNEAYRARQVEYGRSKYANDAEYRARRIAYAKSSYEERLSKDTEYLARAAARARKRRPAILDQEKERLKRRREENREEYRAHRRNYRARKHAAEGTHTAEDVILLLDSQAHRCANHMCHADLRSVGHHIDHTVALSRGGSNAPGNLQALCPKCNVSKHNLSMPEFLIRYFDNHVLGAF